MNLQLSISDVVQWDLPSPEFDDSIKKAVLIMREKKVASLLVRNKGNVVGVISDTDILNSVLRGADANIQQVCDIMTPCEVIGGEKTLNPCAQIDSDESIFNALKVLEKAGTHGLVVSSSSDERVGVVCLKDLLCRALVE